MNETEIAPSEEQPSEAGTYYGQRSPGGQWYWNGTGTPDDKWVPRAGEISPLVSVTDPGMANFMARASFRWQGDPGVQTWLNDLYNMGTAAPTLSSVTPNTIAHGAGATLITATGTGYINSAQVTAGGTALATTYVSATSLTATIPAASLASAGTIQIAVQNPDGRTSSNVAFTVT